MQATALDMIYTIRTAFNELLHENQWMDNATKVVAKYKANSMNERIGYPDFLKDPKQLSREYSLVLLIVITNSKWFLQ